MSKKPSTNNRKQGFNYTPTQSLPKLGAIKTTWDLKKLYYKSEKDPRIEQDVQFTEQAYAAFAKKWRSRKYTESAKLLCEALTEYEALAARPEISRPGRYFGFRSVLDARDTVAEKSLSLLSERLRKASDQMIFFSLRIADIPKDAQKKFLADPQLVHFRYYLERVFLAAKHNLSEAEEKIVRLKSRQSYGRWVDMTEKLLSNTTIVWKKQEIAVPEAIETLDTLPSKEKPKLWALLMDEMERLGAIAEHEFNAIITDVRTEDELRKYPKFYSATALGYEDTEANIESLVEAVSTKGFALSKKFYKLKAKYHGESALHYTRKYDSIGTSPLIPFEQAVTICRDVFYSLKKEYGEIFDHMLTNGQIDVFPRKGKHGGAFMSDETAHPTHVFLNHTSTFKALETLAHEMGHAIHAQRSKTQTPFYDGHSIVTAETASTLFENLMFDRVYTQASKQQQHILLHDRITRDIATIQRQVAFFNCEFEIHQTIKETGGMTNEELRDAMYRHLRSYLGSGITLEKRDGYSYVYVPHLRFGFYVYTYAFGILMSTIMANHYKEDTSYIDKIDTFLCAGSSDTVTNIFKSIDIDTSHKETFLRALDNHAADIAMFEQYVKEQARKK